MHVYYYYYYYYYYLLIVISLIFFILLEFKQPIQINFTTKFGSHYQKKKTLQLPAPRQLHNSQVPLYSPTYIFLPTTNSPTLVQKNISSAHSTHPRPIPLGKNTETTATMSSDPSSNSTDTTISSDSSSDTSKASLKRITDLPCPFLFNMLI